MEDHYGELCTRYTKAQDDPASEKEMEELQNFFNEMFKDHDDLGDILFGGNYTDFSTRIVNLPQQEKQKFTDELQEKGVIQL